ncbi:SURF1 family protein [Piscinibacter gummiphilus]|uniref:SURF1 family protein n=1 Tax=Piscinibacter gummiphilus TaxID=946333 RepID=UPI000A2682DB|nr:SURF1-like protein [Piscinibacter gummiphilus]
MTDLPQPQRSSRALASTVLAGALLFLLFIALGTWQVQRRAWKLDLIQQVETRVHAPPVAAPGRADWPNVTAARDAYRHVTVRGTFDHGRETLVQAATVMGAGHWVLTPLRTADGTTVLVNRGYVPPEKRDRATRQADDPQGEVDVAGLLRITEPGGGFLRKNDPAGDRWFSRDVAGIAAARGITEAAPYFIDQDAPPGARSADRWPVGGLTVVSFPNSHLVYAITWYGLALMVAAGTVFFVRTARRRTMR